MGDIQLENLEIEKLIQQIEEAENRHDIESMLEYMIAEPVLHLCGLPPLHGQDAIRQLYGEFFKTFVSTTITTHKINVSSSGDMAWEFGSYVNVLESSDGRIQDRGKYFGIYHKVEGSWKSAAFCITTNG